MHTEKRFRVSEAEDTGREIGGLMLSINGLHNSTIFPKFHRALLNSDVYMLMSKMGRGTSDKDWTIGKDECQTG